MMRCRMTTCGTSTFEGESRALPVTVTRCFRNIFRCRSALNHLAKESLERCIKRIFFFACPSLSDSRNHAIFYQRLP